MSKLDQRKGSLLNFGGVISAVATPFDDNGKLELSRIEEYAGNLVENKVRGVFILGTTGECFSLTLAEKIDLLKAWMVAIEKTQKKHGVRLLAIVNVSGTVFSEIDSFAKIASDLDVDAIGILPPIYISASKVDDLVQYVNLVGKCAPELPILYYHIPMFTRELNFELSDFLESCLKNVKQLAALKFTDGNLLRLDQIMSRFSDRINIMNGHEETILPSVSIGCRAAICATASLPGAAKLMNILFDSTASLQTKQIAHRSLATIIDNVKQTGNGHFFYGLKHTLNRANLPLEFGVPRLPIYIPKDN